MTLDDPKARDAETLAAGRVKGETACARSACQAPLNDTNGTRWWNRAMFAYYCAPCASLINKNGPYEGGDCCITESEKWQNDNKELIGLALKQVTAPLFRKVKRSD